ncbi:MAG: alanine dehydrogenase [Heliobacteriaceae bacterium]|nr:alanine dehydrogenase [Heliobacteriaceae bacterium]MDD4588088.1 alanine dehydrogenase [Heliobacteriaceae bacterium]
MIIGVPKEMKNNEHRVAVVPSGVEALCHAGHQVLVETGAGVGSGITDEAYQAAGAKILPSAAAVYAAAAMIMKVKAPLSAEFDYLREGQILYTYLHLVAEPDLTKVLLARNVVGVAYETVQLDTGCLPLLTPMSEIAGKMAVQIGARFLEEPHGGKGVLLGGVSGVAPADVVVVGGGTVGYNAAKIAAGMGAQVTILDCNPERLRWLDDHLSGRVQTIMSNPYNVGRAVCYADLLIGAVLVPGGRTPQLVTEEMVKKMKPSSVIIDVAVDQGGSIATIDRVTTHSNPSYIKHGVVHYAVDNIPGAVARTSTFALTNATLPYALEMANKGIEKAARESRPLARGINVYKGKVTNAGVADYLGYAYVPLDAVLEA